MGVLNDAVVHDKIRNMIQMAFIVFFLASIVLRSFVGGLFVLTPLIAVISANFGIRAGWNSHRYHRRHGGGHGHRRGVGL